MDFASLMSAELAKAAPKSKTFTKKAEAEAERLAAYEKEQAALAATRAAKESAKRKAADELAEANRRRDEKRQALAEQSRIAREEREAAEGAARRKRLGLSELKREEDKSEEEKAREDGVEDVEEEELRRRLRKLGAPVVLFGESHWGRVRRVLKLETVVTDGPIPTILKPVSEKEMKLDGTVPKNKKERMYLFRQLSSYFSMVLSEYQDAIEREKKDTSTSRTAYNAMVRCRDDMKPLYRKFEKDDLDESVLAPIIEIVQAIQERRYVDANDGYLRLSIGKAAWPIGVTMVGIHERSAREKLHNGEKGHVMGDEVTRKYLQAIKRMLTFAQVRWPPSDLKQLMG